MKDARNQHAEILIVDDEQTIRLFLSLTLKRLGYDNVQEASNAEEGFEILRRTKPSLVITDIHMPGESGLEFLKKAKKFRPDTGFIIITASDEPGDAGASLNQGADHYLLKPLTIEEVQLAVSNVLEKRRLIRENRGVSEGT